jgi:hypothetical protein
MAGPRRRSSAPVNSAADDKSIIAIGHVLRKYD